MLICFHLNVFRSGRESGSFNVSLMICSIFSPQLQMKAPPPLSPGVVDASHRFYLPVSVKQLPPIRLHASTSHSYLSLSSEILHQQLLTVLIRNWQDQWKTFSGLGSCHQVYLNLKLLSVYWHQRAQKVGMGCYCRCTFMAVFFDIWVLSIHHKSLARSCFQVLFQSKQEPCGPRWTVYSYIMFISIEEESNVSVSHSVVSNSLQPQGL